jgi:initiation factor 1A
MLGHGRLNAVCEDGVTRLCSISGKLKKRKTNGFIVRGDIILICVRPFNNKLADVLYKYSNLDIQQFLQGKVPVSDLLRDMIADVGSSNVGDVEFGYTSDISINSSDDDLDIGSNNNRQLQYSDEELDDIDNIDSYGIAKKSNIIDKRIKTKDKRDRRNNWKKNYENSRQNDVKIDNL